MTLIVRPVGRGNWRPQNFTVDERHVPPMLVQVGQRFELGGVMFRISRVLP
jgi:hypothetical protein